MFFIFKDVFFLSSDKGLGKGGFSVAKVFSSPIICYLVPFICLGGYLVFCIVANKIPQPNGYYLIHYLYVYDHGFVARGLVGEVISWFAQTVTDELIYNVIIGFSALLMISASLCIGKALTKVRNDEKRLSWILFLIAILCVLPMSFKMYYADMKLDKMLWALTFFAVFLSDRKYGVWFVPILCVLATLINPVFLFCSMILIAIILLQEFYSNRYSLKNGIICGVSYISMIAVGLYGTISEKWIGFDTPEEFIDYYFSRYAGSLNQSEYNLFATEWLFDYFEPLDKIFETSFRIYFQEWGNGIICILNFILIAFPTYILLSIFWKKVIKAETNKLQKFIYFLCAISPVVIIPPVSISWEFSKYFYNNFIMQVCLIIFFIVRENPAILSAVEETIECCKKHIVLTAAVIIYFSGCYLYYVPV